VSIYIRLQKERAFFGRAGESPRIHAFVYFPKAFSPVQAKSGRFRGYRTGWGRGDYFSVTKKRQKEGSGVVVLSHKEPASRLSTHAYLPLPPPIDSGGWAVVSLVVLYCYRVVGKW